MEKVEVVPGKYIGEGFPCFIIAEIGQNHQGDVEIAKEMILEAKKCGADCVKLQKSCLLKKFTNNALKRKYRSGNSFGETYGQHKQFLEFSEQEFKVLQAYAKHVEIPLTASAMDLVSVDFLDSIDVPFIKIGSSDVHNLPLIKKAAKTERPLIISTGMSDILWISEMYQEVRKIAPKVPIILLQCTSAYPVPSTHVNLRVMDTYAEMFPDAHIGYSGHELGIHISISAVALGAKVLERHFTLNKKSKGSDHVCSLDPTDFRTMVNAIRQVETSLGSPIKTFQKSEIACYRKLGKSVVASKDLNVGHILTENDIEIKVSEPEGLPGTMHDRLIGKRLKKNVDFDNPIQQEALEDFSNSEV